MADKKQTKSQSKTASAQTGSLPKEVEEKLNSNEKAAIQELSATEKTGTKYRLKNKDTQYTDPINGWTIASDQEKEIPTNCAASTYARIKEGFLVKVDG